MREVAAVRHAEYVEALGIDAVRGREPREQGVEESDVGEHLVRSEAKAAAERIRIDDDEAVALRRLVQPRVFRHHVLAVDQHAVKRHDERRGPLQVDVRRHEQPVHARRAAHAQRFIGELAVLRRRSDRLLRINVGSRHAAWRSQRGQRERQPPNLHLLADW